ncbi:MAG: glycosyltransferase family 4 protein [Ignavibacteria bacterium]|nr:glycosyltransferase family 4 protein [Ignavibacteria bacterium]
MKILIVSSAYWPYPSGVSEVVYYLAQGLCERGHNIKVLTTNYPQIHDDDHVGNFEVIRVGKAVKIHINKSVSHIPLGSAIPFKIKHLLEDHRFDIIHYHNCYPLELEFWALHFSKTINCVTYHTAGFRKSLLYNIGAHIFRKYTKKIHGHIAISKIAQEWSEPYFPGDYRVIPNGIDTNRFSLSVKPLDKPKDSFVILYLSRIDKRKGIFVALDAFNRLKGDFPNALLYIVGHGPLGKQAREYAQELNLDGRCRFFGYVNRNELARFYRTCDVYISPALGGEAQGLVLLEAMACGKAVIASDISGYNEVIENGENGILFKPDSSLDLAQKIGELIRDEKLSQSMAMNARLHAERYSWDKIVRRIEAYYQELIKCNELLKSTTLPDSSDRMRTE